MPDVSLNLLVLRSSDPDRLARFYGLLGIYFTREQHGAGPEHLAAQLGGLVFELYPQRTGKPEGAGVRLGFRIPVVEAAVEAVRRAGAVVVSEPRQTVWGLRAVVQDPDGRRVEVSEASVAPAVGADQPHP